MSDAFMVSRKVHRIGRIVHKQYKLVDHVLTNLNRGKYEGYQMVIKDQKALIDSYYNMIQVEGEALQEMDNLVDDMWKTASNYIKEDGFIFGTMEAVGLVVSFYFGIIVGRVTA